MANNPPKKKDAAQARAHTAARKAQRKAAQELREAANKTARTRGEPTGHELKLTQAAERRAKNNKNLPIIISQGGNYIVKISVIDEHGTTMIDGIRPCCNAKSFYKCNHIGSSLPKRRFYLEPHHM